MKLEARRLSVTLAGRPVLHAVDAALESGEVVGLIGANGSGKSTLLKALAGLSSPGVAAGEVLLDGKPLGGMVLRERARRIGYLPQSPECHWPLSVERMVALGRLPWGGSGDSGEAAMAAEKVKAALKEADALHLRGRIATELSGGERARVHLARVLAGDPALLLADEPGAGLDPFHQLQLMELLVRLARGERRCGAIGVMVVLHDLGLAARFCDRLLLLSEGGILASGPPAEVLADGPLAKAHRVRVFRACHDGAPVVVPWERL